MKSGSYSAFMEAAELPDRDEDDACPPPRCEHCGREMRSCRPMCVYETIAPLTKPVIAILLLCVTCRKEALRKIQQGTR